jgi:hypothetical protein
MTEQESGLTDQNPDLGHRVLLSARSKRSSSLQAVRNQRKTVISCTRQFLLKVNPMPILDPETKGLIKLGLDEKRAIDEGRLDPKDAYNLPPSLRTRNSGASSGGGDAIETIAVGAGIIVIIAFYLLAGALAGVVVRKVLLFEVGGLQLYVPIGLSLACLAIGTAFWLYRDVRRYWQVAVATAAGVVGVLAAPDYITKGVALGGAAVAVADGIEKLAKARVHPKA